MNYSSTFRRQVRLFFTASSAPVGHCIHDYDDNRLFCYLKNVDKLYPVVIPRESTSFGNIVFPVMSYVYEPRNIEKAENIIGLRSYRMQRVTLGENTYYAAFGCVFDKDKNPIIMTCAEEFPLRSVLICIDYSVIEYPDEPMAKFILKKLIPYFVETRDSDGYRYAFMNCDKFVVKPTFQGELDHNLVSKYLCERLDTEFALSKG